MKYSLFIFFIAVDALISTAQTPDSTQFTRRWYADLVVSQVVFGQPEGGVSCQIAPRCELQVSAGYMKHRNDTIYKNLYNYSVSGAYLKVGAHIGIRPPDRFAPADLRNNRNAVTLGANLLYSRLQETGSWRIAGGYWGDYWQPLVNRPTSFLAIEAVMAAHAPILQQRLYLDIISRVALPLTPRNDLAPPIYRVPGYDGPYNIRSLPFRFGWKIGVSYRFR